MLYICTYDKINNTLKKKTHKRLTNKRKSLQKKKQQKTKFTKEKFSIQKIYTKDKFYQRWESIQMTKSWHISICQL